MKFMIWEERTIKGGYQGKLKTEQRKKNQTERQKNLKAVKKKKKK